MDILESLTSSLKSLDFSVFAYLPHARKMYQLHKGEADIMNVPAVIKPGLEKDGKPVIFFKKGEEILVFFFFRLRMENEEIVLVVQDEKGGNRPADVLSVFAGKALACLNEPQNDSSLQSLVSSTNDESLKRELEKMIGRVTELEISASEKDSKILEMQRRLFAQNELLSKLEDIKDAEFEGSNEIMALKEQIIEKNEMVHDLKTEAAALKLEAESIGSKLAEYDEVMAESDMRSAELETELEKLSEQLIKCEEFTEVLKTSRNKIMKLMDGMPMPLFSVDKEYKVKNVNRAGGNFAGIEKLNEIVGQECYKAFYGFDQPCSWCHLKEVLENAAEATEHIDVQKGDDILKIEQSMYPIQNKEGEVDEIGEHLLDITEQFELINSIESYRGQVKKFKLAKLNDINEIEVLKKEYSSLSENYEDLQNKYNKIRTALERLLSEDKMNELLKTRNENAELRNKLTRAASALRNYQVNLDESKLRYTELNKKTIYQLERLINVINNKNTLKQPDIEQSLTFVTNEIARVKKEMDKLCGGKTTKSGVNDSVTE